LTTESFEEIWKILEEKTENRSKLGILTRRILPDSPFDIYLGFEKPSNRRMIQVRVSKENILNIHSFSRSRGVKLNQTVFLEDQGQFVTIELILTEKQYQDIFTILSEDIVNRCTREKSEREMLHSFISRLEKWQQFLEQYGLEGLSTVAQRGLYGELRFLRDFLIPLIGAEKAVSSWTGPYKTQQDFQTSGIAIEVKTGAGKLPQRIQISSEQQLDNSGIDALYLYYLSLRELNDDGETLPAIIDSIRKICDSYIGITSTFNDLLFHAGYLEDYRNKYENRGYADRSSYIFLVNGDFPRITENQLISGVGDVRYSINLSSCMPFIVSEDNFRLLMKRYFNGN
jgi:hypothetical protein